MCLVYKAKSIYFDGKILLFLVLNYDWRIGIHLFMRIDTK
jgi:hypothetical protein